MPVCVCCAVDRMRNPVAAMMESNTMARDGSTHLSLDDLSDAEIERIEATIFCMGGPPASVSAALLERAAAIHARLRRR